MAGVNDTVCQFTAIVNKKDCQSVYRRTGVNAVDIGHQQYHRRQISVILRRAFLVKSQFLTVNYHPIYVV
jgi:hypothetical protein